MMCYSHPSGGVQLPPAWKSQMVTKVGKGRRVCCTWITPG